MLEHIEDVKEKLKGVDAKLDYCLTLLGVLVTADGFQYNLLDKSNQWINTIAIAERQAFAVSEAVIARHPECKELSLIAAQVGELPTEMVAAHDWTAERV